jgi:hypothetical protein
VVSSHPYQHSTAAVAVSDQKQKVPSERSFQRGDNPSSLIEVIVSLPRFIPFFSLEYASLHSFSKTIGCSLCCSS